MSVSALEEAKVNADEGMLKVNVSNLTQSQALTAVNYELGRYTEAWNRTKRTSLNHQIKFRFAGFVRDKQRLYAVYAIRAVHMEYVKRG